MKKIMKDIFLKLMFNILKLHEIHNDLTLLPETMKIEKIKKLVPNLHGKAEYVLHMKNLKLALGHGLFLKKFHRIIKFQQKAWLMILILNNDMNTELKKKAKNDLEKFFLR